MNDARIQVKYLSFTVTRYINPIETSTCLKITIHTIFIFSKYSKIDNPCYLNDIVNFIVINVRAQLEIFNIVQSWQRGCIHIERAGLKKKRIGKELKRYITFYLGNMWLRNRKLLLCNRYHVICIVLTNYFVMERERWLILLNQEQKENGFLKLMDGNKYSLFSRVKDFIYLFYNIIIQNIILLYF